MKHQKIFAYAIITVGGLALFTALYAYTGTGVREISGMISGSTERPSPNLIATDVAYGFHAQQRYSIRYDEALEAQPLIVLVHGGLWRSGDKRPMMDTFGGFFIDRGAAVMSVNYRLAPKYHFPAQPEDVACAIATVIDKAKEYHIDPKRIVILGYAEGAHLGALVAFHNDRDWLSSCPITSPFSTKGFIGISGLYDLEALPKDHEYPGLRWLLGSRYDEGSWDQASPIAWVDRGDPAALLIHGTDDSVVSYRQSVAMNETILKQTSHGSDLLLVPNANHEVTLTNFGDNKQMRDQMAEFFKKEIQ